MGEMAQDQEQKRASINVQTSMVQEQQPICTERDAGRAVEVQLELLRKLRQQVQQPICTERDSGRAVELLRKLNQQEQQPICTERDAGRAVELLRKLRQQASYHTYKGNPAAMEQLDLLERALDSDLFKSVCHVYDQIHDTVNITQPSDLKASASAKATVAVFSASIGHSHPRTVDLPKTEAGLGFNVMSFDGSAVFVSRITPGGVADKHGGLRRGDQLISIDGVNVENEDHIKAVELLKAAKGQVSLVVKYMPALLNQIEESFAMKQQQQQ